MASSDKIPISIIQNSSYFHFTSLPILKKTPIKIDLINVRTTPESIIFLLLEMSPQSLSIRSHWMTSQSSVKFCFCCHFVVSLSQLSEPHSALTISHFYCPGFTFANVLNIFFSSIRSKSATRFLSLKIGFWLPSMANFRFYWKTLLRGEKKTQKASLVQKWTAKKS